MFKTHTCGELRAEHTGKTVQLAGWVHRRRDHGGVIFIDLRDRYGLTQIVINPSNVAADNFKISESLRSEFVVQVEGKVSERPEGMHNPKMLTGDIELMVEKLTVLNPAKTPPRPRRDPARTRRHLPLSVLAGTVRTRKNGFRAALSGD